MAGKLGEGGGVGRGVLLGWNRAVACWRRGSGGRRRQRCAERVLFALPERVCLVIFYGYLLTFSPLNPSVFVWAVCLHVTVHVHGDVQYLGTKKNNVIVDEGALSYLPLFHVDEATDRPEKCSKHERGKF